MTTTLDTIADALPGFEEETFGLVYTLPLGQVVVTEDGGDLLVGLYGPEGYTNAEEQTEGVIIPEDATDAEALETVRQYIHAAGAIIEGHTYTARTTGKLRGERIYRDVTFTAARTMEPEPFIRNRGPLAIDQDRIFRRSGFGSEPLLIITGTLREA